MRQQQSVKKLIFSFVVAGVLFLLLFFNIGGFSASLQHLVLRTVSPVMRPLNSASKQTALWASAVLHFQNVADDQAALVAHNRDLAIARADLALLDAENHQLRDALGIREAMPKSTIVARSLGFFRDGRNEFILLDRGTNDGVLAGQFVLMSTSTLVGRISEVTKDTSKALLISSPSEVLQVSILGKEPEAISRGNNMREMIVDFVPVTSGVVVGDLIVTNAKEEGLGAGFVVGIVADVRDVASNVFKYVRAESLFDPRASALLFIVRP